MDRSNSNTALASALTEELVRSGVTHAVISPGSRSTPLAVALWRQPGIEVTVAIDERSGSFFALGAAQASGKPVALVCTSGTAAANFHPAVAEADLSNVPLIVLTADRPPELRDNGSGQTIDQIKLFGSSVRWFSEVGTHVADDEGLLHMRSIACRAFAVASGDPRPGPVHLNLSWREPLAPISIEGAVTATSVLALEGRGGQPLTSVEAAPQLASPEVIESLVNKINSAEAPLIVAGRQTDPALAEPLANLARLLGAPLLAEPTSQLRFGSHDLDPVMTSYEAICGQDEPPLAPSLVLRFGEMPTSKQLRIWLKSLGPETEQIVIDPTWSWNEPTRHADSVIRAEPVALLDAMEGKVKRFAHLQRGDFWGHDIERTEDPLPSVPPTGPDIHRALAFTHQSGDIVYTASSMSIRDQEAAVPKRDVDVLFLANRGANGIDGLIASGVGASVATGRPVTIITGDLGFQHDVGSLALVPKDGPAVRIIVINNNGGAIFSKLPQKQAMDANEFENLMTTPGGMNIKAAADLFGMSHSIVREMKDLPDALAVGTSVIEVLATA